MVKMENIQCEFCPRKREKENNTNWIRHIDACKKKHINKNQVKRKNTEGHGKITKFLKTSNACIEVTSEVTVNSNHVSTVNSNGTILFC